MLNTYSHVGGFVIACVMFVVLMQQTQDDMIRILTFIFYGFAVMMMFLVSALYHGMKNKAYRNILRRFDHAYIFVLILATYTPIVFLSVKTQLAYALYVVLFGMTIVGVVFKLYFSHRFKRIVTVLFVVMGWLSLLLVPTIVQTGNIDLMLWLIIGGLIYTVGAVIYIVGQFPYYHFIWHLFVLGGVFAHYVAILYYV